MKPIKNDKYFSIKKYHLMRLKIPSKNSNQLILIIFTLKHFANILSPLLSGTAPQQRDKLMNY
ncbi:hypothetical protein B9T38_10095 [Acinetobacter sp. ANC 4218]|nr:hypothetical protein B9T38_10095 [Acinetobacter sp. ANC 4218]